MNKPLNEKTRQMGTTLMASLISNYQKEMLLILPVDTFADCCSLNIRQKPKKKKPYRSIDSPFEITNRVV